MKFEKLWEPGQEKMHWKEVLNYYSFCGNLYVQCEFKHLDIPKRFGKLKKTRNSKV